MDMLTEPLASYGQAAFAVLLPFIGPTLVVIGRSAIRMGQKVLERNSSDHEMFQANMLEVSQKLAEISGHLTTLSLQAQAHESMLANHESRLANHEHRISSQEDRLTQMERQEARHAV